VLIQCDNTAAVAAFKKGTSSDEVVMKWLRELFWLSARGGFKVKAMHIEGRINVLADLLSRRRMEEFEEKREKWQRARAGERGELWEKEPWLARMWELEEEGKRVLKERRGIRA